MLQLFGTGKAKQRRFKIVRKKMRYKIRIFMAIVMTVSVLFCVGCSNVISETRKIQIASAPAQNINSHSSKKPIASKGEFPSAEQPLPVIDEEAKAKAEAEAKAKAEAEAKAKAEAEAKAKAEAEAKAKAEAEAKAKAEAEAKAKAEAEAKAKAEAEAKAKAEAEAAEAAARAQATKNKADKPDEVRAVWISYLDFYSLLQNQSKSNFTYNMDRAFDKISSMGLNTVYIQVRPFGDALYDSDIFPYSYVITDVEGKDPGFDPLEIMIELADDYDLRVEAWINPYRVRAIGSDRELASSNPAVKAVRAGSGLAIQYNGGIFYNPASSDARNLITQGVIELIENYDIDGIHFDDYFYPTTDLSFDKYYYNSYRNSGGTLSQADWRRQNVDKLIQQVYTAIKNADSSIVFGISPQARDDINYDGQFAHTESWLKNGWVDYICPQIYYGFQNETAPYKSTLNYWHDLAKKHDTDLYVGLAAYKCGTADSYAGSGKSEWINNADMLSRMVESARNKSSYAGFALYRYDSLFNPAGNAAWYISKEIKSLKELF